MYSCLKWAGAKSWESSFPAISVSVHTSCYVECHSKQSWVWFKQRIPYEIIPKYKSMIFFFFFISCSTQKTAVQSCAGKTTGCTELVSKWLATLVTINIASVPMRWGRNWLTNGNKRITSSRGGKPGLRENWNCMRFMTVRHEFEGYTCQQPYTGKKAWSLHTVHTTYPSTHCSLSPKGQLSVQRQFKAS